MKYLLPIIVFVFIGCSGTNEKKKEPSVRVSDVAEPVLSEKNIEETVMRKIGLDPRGEYKYRAVTVKEFPINLNRRSEVRIIVPEGLNNTDLTNTLKKAVSDYFRKLNDPKALSILAYREGDKTEGAYTVAKMDFAPFGDWGNKSYGDYENYELDVSINENYFKPKPAVKTISSVYTVYRATKYVKRNGKRVEVPASSVNVYRTTGDITDENKIGEIPNNSKIEIIDTFSESLPQGFMWISYKVKYKNLTGWIMDSDIKK